MRYLVHAELKPGLEKALLQAIEDGTLGLGSVAGREYIRDMHQARELEDGSVRWVEVCYCPTPLEEEIPYWEAYFELTKIMNAHHPDKCRDLTGEEHWACSDCDCTAKLEATMEGWGSHFLTQLQQRATDAKSGRDAAMPQKSPLTWVCRPAKRADTPTAKVFKQKSETCCTITNQ